MRDKNNKKFKKTAWYIWGSIQEVVTLLNDQGRSLGGNPSRWGLIAKTQWNAGTQSPTKCGEGGWVCHDIQETRRARRTPASLWCFPRAKCWGCKCFQSCRKAQTSPAHAQTYTFLLSAYLPYLLPNINNPSTGNGPKVDTADTTPGKGGLFSWGKAKTLPVCLSPVTKLIISHNVGDCRKDLDKPPTHLPALGSFPGRQELQVVSRNCLQTHLPSGTWRLLSWCVYEHVCVCVSVWVYVCMCVSMCKSACVHVCWAGEGRERTLSCADL